MDNTIKITSLNYRRHGLCSPQIPRVFANTDVLLCQEISTKKDINIVKNQITGLEKDLNCKIYFSDIASDVRLVTFVKNKLKKYVRFEQVAVGRATCLQLQNEDYNYNIINVYGPAYHSPTDYIKFCESIFKYTDTHTDAVLMGDWNSLMDDSMCSRPRNDQHRKCAGEVQRLFENWIHIHTIIKSDYNFTYGNVNNYRSRVDRAYTKQVEIQKFFDYNIFPVTFSDHDAIFIKIKWRPRPRWGKGSWKMNTQVLDDPRFELGLKQVIVTFNENNKYVKIADSWEALKSQVKKLAKETSAEQRKEKNSELQILNKDLLELRKLIVRPQSTEEDAIAYNDLKNKIEDKKKEKEEGERIRARVEKTLHDEKPSKYFFNKEKKGRVTTN